MPEIILYNFLQSVFQIVKKDHIDKIEEETILYRVFKEDMNNNNVELETFDYYKQSLETFIKKTPEVNLGYNMEVSAQGCVHILLPNESGKPMNLGGSENYLPNLLNKERTEYNQIYNQSFTSTYNLMISSENTFEVILIYNLLKASFISLYSHLELSGLQNMKLGGSDVTMQGDLVPTHIFHRSLTATFDYEVNIPNYFSSKLIKNFNLTGIILSDDE